MNDLKSSSQRIFNRYQKSQNALRKAQAKHAAIESAFIDHIKAQPIGLHAAIDHHIFNTEKRPLTDTERAEFSKRYDS